MCRAVRTGIVVAMNEHGWGPPGPGFDHIHGGVPFFAPFLGVGMFLLTLLLIGAVLFHLARRGKIGPPPWLGSGRVSPFSPEYEARKTLATRFANGEIASDEFLERAAALNWTPGVEPQAKPGKKKRP